MVDMPLTKETKPNQGEQDKTEKPSYGADKLQKAYDLVPQSWIIDCLKMYKIFGKVIKFIKNTMGNWRVKLTAEGKKRTCQVVDFAVPADWLPSKTEGKWKVR